MGNFSTKIKNNYYVWALSFLVGLIMLILITFSPILNKDLANAAPVPSNPSVYSSAGTHFEEISATNTSFSVSENGTFTLAFVGGYSTDLPNENSYYILNLYNSVGTKISFPENSSFQLIDYSPNATGRNAIYRLGLNVAGQDINLQDFTYLGNEFHVQTEWSDNSETETLQIIFSTPLDIGNYKIELVRYDSGAENKSWEQNLIITAQQTTFSLSATKTHETVYTDSTESINLTITPSNSTDETIRKLGRGIRISFVGDTAMPTPTKFQLFEGQTQVGDDWELEKSYAFNTNATSNLRLDLTFPTNVIADGTYSLLIELFTEDGQTLASTTLSLPLLNINYKAKAITMIDNGQGYSKFLVYSLNATSGLAFNIEENLPDDATIKFNLEKRNISGGFDILGSQTELSITDFRNELISTNGLTNGYEYNQTLANEGVFRFRLEVYDRNGDLKFVAFSYVVCAKPNLSTTVSI